MGCKTCGAYLPAQEGRGRPRQYCSAECYPLRERIPVEYEARTCLLCNGDFTPRTKLQRYCCGECQAHRKRADGTIGIRCAHCGAATRRRVRDFTIHGPMGFCSRGCATTHRARKLPVLAERTTIGVVIVPGREPAQPRTLFAGNCAHCREPFVSTAGRARYCSDWCGRRHAKNAYRRKRRAIIKGAQRVESIDPTTVYTRDNWTCRLCRKAIDPALDPQDNGAASLDHILPLSLGGTHTYDNVQSAHRICNIRKSANVDQLAIGL